MAESPGILVYSIAGKVETPRDGTLAQRLSEIRRAIPRQAPNTKAAGSSEQAAAAPGAAAAATESDPASILNAAAKDIAREIEREVLALLPPDPSLTIQAEIRFRSGSLLMMGTLAVLNWAGLVILDEVRNQFAEVVKVAVQRVVGEAVSAIAPGLPPMQCTVTSRYAATTPAAERQQAEPTRFAPGRYGWRDIVLAILAVVVVIQLLDRFIVIAVREPVQQATATATK
ncbi:MAG: hypothetical protein ACRC67_43690 [Inquilinus sp.]|uniref:hypothetical protein n=1 Tax=Inquilinus sp. TaxID=1932117 RepID=UPI003F41AA55